jgi:Type VI secretion system, TssN
MELTSARTQIQHLLSRVRSERHITENEKRTLIYSGAFILCAGVFSFLFGDGLIEGRTSAAGRAAFTGIFLLVGIAHLFYFPKLLPHLSSGNTVIAIIFSFVLAFFLTDCIFFFLYVTGVKNIGLAVAAGCAFFLPYIINQCMLYYKRIDTREYENWVIPPGTEPDTRKSLLLNSTFFKIKMKLTYFDVNDVVFNVNLPGRITLCAAFCRFLYDQQNNIEVSDDKKQPYAWRFSVKGPLGKRVLDPECTLAKNGIKESDIILIERIRLS